jgi:hypothetical protein
VHVVCSWISREVSDLQGHGPPVRKKVQMKPTFAQSELTFALSSANSVLGSFG